MVSNKETFSGVAYFPRSLPHLSAARSLCYSFYSLLPPVTLATRFFFFLRFVMALSLPLSLPSLLSLFPLSPLSLLSPSPLSPLSLSPSLLSILPYVVCSFSAYLFLFSLSHTIENKHHGYGLKVWSSGDTYEGEWKEDKIHGK